MEQKHFNNPPKDPDILHLSQAYIDIRWLNVKDYKRKNWNKTRTNRFANQVEEGWLDWTHCKEPHARSHSKKKKKRRKKEKEKKKRKSRRNTWRRDKEPELKRSVRTSDKTQQKQSRIMFVNRGISSTDGLMERQA
jgi:hypothetical protein